jgi:uncharacterized protein (DUF169 family)
MYWQAWSDRLKAELKLDANPIAVTFAGPQAPAAAPSGAKVSVCQALEKAGRGETVSITAETCGCAGGLVSLGLGQTPAAGREKLASFLIDKEKVYCSRVAMHRSRETVPAPLAVASQVVFSPLGKATALPDVVSFLGKPGSLHELIGLASYWDGMSMKAELAGPACRTGIAYPIVTGQIGLSLLDHGARRLADFGADQLLVSVPFHRMLGVMHALDQGVGGGRIKERARMELQIDELGKVERA